MYNLFMLFRPVYSDAKCVINKKSSLPFQLFNSVLIILSYHSKIV